MEAIPFTSISIWFIAKIFVIIGLSIYVIFALVVVRQIQLMTVTLEVGFEIPVKLLGFTHLLFAIGVLVIALITL